MSTMLWIVLAVAAVAVLAYVLAMRDLLRKSRELDKKIDYSKIRRWNDDEN